MRAGPAGNRELRIAIEPSGSSANSTQLPFGLLAVDFRQRASSSPAGMPFLTCNFSSRGEGRPGETHGVQITGGRGKSSPALCSLTDQLHVQTAVQQALQRLRAWGKMTPIGRSR